MQTVAVSEVAFCRPYALPNQPIGNTHRQSAPPALPPPSPALAAPIALSTRRLLSIIQACLSNYNTIRCVSTIESDERPQPRLGPRHFGSTCTCRIGILIALGSRAEPGCRAGSGEAPVYREGVQACMKSFARPS